MSIPFYMNMTKKTNKTGFILVKKKHFILQIIEIKKMLIYSV